MIDPEEKLMLNPCWQMLDHLVETMFDAGQNATPIESIHFVQPIVEAV